MKFKKAGVIVSAIASTAVCASLIAGTFKNTSTADCGAIQLTHGNRFSIIGNTFDESVQSNAIRFHETEFDGSAEVVINDNVINSLYLINGYREGFKVTSKGNTVKPTRYMEKDTQIVKDSTIVLG